jgi:hypothetical protein
MKYFFMYYGYSYIVLYYTYSIYRRQEYANDCNHSPRLIVGLGKFNEPVKYSVRALRRNGWMSGDGQTLSHVYVTSKVVRMFLAMCRRACCNEMLSKISAPPCSFILVTLIIRA